LDACVTTTIPLPGNRTIMAHRISKKGTTNLRYPIRSKNGLVINMVLYNFNTGWINGACLPLGTRQHSSCTA